MSVTIVAANLKTESGDSYLYLFDQVSGPEEFVELIERSMGEELQYVFEYDIQVLYGDADVYEDALRKRSDQLMNGDDE